MVHFSCSERPEVLLFGHDQQVDSPRFLFAGKRIMITAADGERLKVSRFAPGEEDRSETCSAKLEDLIRSIANLGGGYGDVKQAIDEAKTGGFLQSRVVVDALPRPGRVYRRNEEQEDESSAAPLAANSLPDMFSDGSPAGPTGNEEQRGD
jgi:hypothetical protein